MTIFHFFALAFSVFAISRVFLRYKSRNETLGEFLFWSLLWIAVIVFSIQPQWTTTVAQFLGIARGADFVFLSGTIVLMYLLFRLYIKVDNIDKDITRLIVKSALQDAQKTKPSPPQDDNKS